MTATMTKGARSRGKAKATARKNRVIPEMVGVGKRLQQARTTKGMTQADLAAKAGTSEQDIGQLENGWRSISIPRAYMLAKAVGVTGEWLVTGISPKTHAALVSAAKKFQKEFGKAADESGEGAPVTA